MATYFVSSAGSNTSPYDTWAKAATSLQTALTAASGGTDVVVVKYDGVPSGDAELSADTAYTTANSVSIISASADDSGTSYTPTAMGTSYWIGNSTTNRYVRLDGGADDKVYWYGFTFRVSGSTSDDIRINGASIGCDMILENCYFWQGNTNGSALISSGPSSTTNLFKDCTFRFGSTSQSIVLLNSCRFENCTISSDGSTPSTLLTNSGTVGNRPEFSGCDLSLITGTLVANTGQPMEVVFERCKLGAAVTVLATQTSNPTLSSACAYVFDCNSGDTHITFGHYNALGSAVSDTGIYFTSGAAAQSWKVVTSANASFWDPYQTPWIDLYNTGTSAITPYFEILRDGSTTAYQNDEVWGEFSAKTTSGSTKANFSSDRKDIDTGTAAADQTAGAGTGSWTGEAASAWSGKVDSGSSITPAEVGYIRARVCVGEPSITVYIDPQIRT